MMTHFSDWRQLSIIVLSKLVWYVIFWSIWWLIGFWWAFICLTLLLRWIRILFSKLIVVLTACCWIRLLLLIWLWLLLIRLILLIIILRLNVGFVIILSISVSILFLVRLIIIVTKVVNWRRGEFIIHLIIHSFIISFIKPFWLFHIFVDTIWVPCKWILIPTHEVVHFWLVFIVWDLLSICIILCTQNIKVSACSLSMVSLWCSWVSKSYFFRVEFVVITQIVLIIWRLFWRLSLIRTCKSCTWWDIICRFLNGFIIELCGSVTFPLLFLNLCWIILISIVFIWCGWFLYFREYVSLLKKGVFHFEFYFILCLKMILLIVINLTFLFETLILVDECNLKVDRIWLKLNKKIKSIINK